MLVLFITALFIIAINRDDDAAMKKYLLEGESIIHIECLDPKEAIVFYRGRNHFGYVGYNWLKKNALTWKHVRGSGVQVGEVNYKLDGGYWYYDLAVGIGVILDPEIKKVLIAGENSGSYPAEIIEDIDGNRFWYFISDLFDTYEITATGLSGSNDIIEIVELKHVKVKQ